MRKAHLLTTSAARYAGAMLAAMTMFAMGTAAAQAPEGKLLGHWPLCEASAALVVDCPGSSSSCLLVGDNEEKGSLFWFKLDGTPINQDSQQQLKFKGGQIDDIEALAKLRDGRIVVFGSHSRTTKCEDRPDRRRFAVIDRLTKESARVKVTPPTTIDDHTLFGQQLPDQPLIKAAAKAIEAAEAEAKPIGDRFTKGQISEDEAKAQCNQTNAYNAEGAVNVSTVGAPDIWIGLRAPLLPRPKEANGDTGGLALLMHLKGLDAYSFDKVAALDLQGFGIRELAYADGWVYVISGPPQDLGKHEKMPFQLWRFQAKFLKGNKMIVPEERHREALPTSSEGLAVFGDKLLVLIDGAKPPKGQEQCTTPARFVVRKLSDFLKNPQFK